VQQIINEYPLMICLSSILTHNRVIVTENTSYFGFKVFHRFLVMLARLPKWVGLMGHAWISFPAPLNCAQAALGYYETSCGGSLG
jgi:hypothetical protein